MFFFVCAPALAAAQIQVSTEADLRVALLQASPGTTIQLTADITLTGDLPSVSRNLTIDGGGTATQLLLGGSADADFFVDGFRGGRRVDGARRRDGELRDLW